MVSDYAKRLAHILVTVHETIVRRWTEACSWAKSCNPRRRVNPTRRGFPPQAKIPEDNQRLIQRRLPSADGSINGAGPFAERHCLFLQRLSVGLASK